MDSKFKISMTLGESPPPEGIRILLQHLKQVMQEQFRTDDEKECLLTLPASENKRLDGIWDNTQKEILRNFVLSMNESSSKFQIPHPDIDIHLFDRRGAQKLIYKGLELKEIVKPPTVTLDTNVLMVWWKKRDKVEQVEELLKYCENFQIDLAVTRRIRDDVPREPLINRVNELPSLNIHETGSVIRPGYWKVGDVAGNDEFKEFFNHPDVIKKRKLMGRKKCLDWRDWDHLHTHYRYGRECFLTWDGGILDFAQELKKILGITVMKPEQLIECLSARKPVR